MSDPLAAIPDLGAGVRHSGEIHQRLLDCRDAIDFIEIFPDDYFEGRRRVRLEQLIEAYTVIPHGLNLSIGRAGSLDRQYLREAKRISDITGAPYYSEHLALSSVPGMDVGHLAPIWYTEATLDVVVRNVRMVQDYLEKPLVLENITYDVVIPGATIDQAEFFRLLSDETGCGILLDVTNLHINAVNHGFDAHGFLDRFPLDKVVQVHLVGGYWRDGYLIDGHRDPVQPELWAMFTALAARIAIKGTIIEREENLADFDQLRGEVARARAIMRSNRPAREPVAAGPWDHGVPAR